MKNFICFLSVIMMTAIQGFAQKAAPVAGFNKADLPVVYLPVNTTIHLVSPEPIQYVDISNHLVKGDIPVKNILRLKLLTDTLKGNTGFTPNHDAVVTVVGEKFIAQYRVVPVNAEPFIPIQTDIEIIPAHTRPLDYPGVGLSQHELRNYAYQLLDNKPEKHLEHSKAYGLKANVNHIYTLGDYIFLDIGYHNETGLKYDIDELRFKIDDQKITKASNVQSLEIKPEFTLLETPSFKKNYRNVFVFKKFTFPGNKVLQVELSEKQVSGRIITLQISYKNIIEADTIPLH